VICVLRRITVATPGWLQAIVDVLTLKPIEFILKKDKKYTLDVADEQLSNSECYHLLRIVGAHMDEFKNSDLKKYFNTSEHLFEKTIWSPGELGKFVEDIVSFCASVETGHINATALTSVLSTLLKTELSQSEETINKIETNIIYSEKTQECGVVKLHFMGDQIQVKGCCSSQGTNTKVNVQKDLIIFKDSKELLLSLRTFTRQYR